MKKNWVALLNPMIRTQLMFSFGVLLILMLIVNAVAITQMTKMYEGGGRLTQEGGNDGTKVAVDHFGQVLLGQRGVALVNENSRKFFELFLISSSKNVDQAQFKRIFAEQVSTSVQITQLYQDFQKTLHDPQEHKLFEQIQADRLDYIAARTQAEQTLAAGRKSDALDALHQQVLPKLETYLRAWRALNNYERTLAIQADADATQTYRAAKYAMFSILAISIAFSSFISYVVTRRITWSLRKIQDAAKQLAAGHFQSRITVSSNDEIADLAHTFNRMADDLSASHTELIGHQHALEDRVIARTKELIEVNAGLTEVNEKLSMATLQLMQSEKLASLGQLSAGIAHEINNPIGYIHSNLGVLGKYLAELFEVLAIYETAEPSIGEPAIKEELAATKEKIELDFLKTDVLVLMKESVDGIKRVKEIVQNLKNFSRVDTDLNWAFSNLHQGIDATLKVINHEVKYKADIVLEYGDLPEIECHLSELNQVFLNLIVNSAQAIGSERGVILIRTRVAGENVVVEIKDNGTGISKENIEHIFDPFFTTKPVGKGTGLGLSISYGIIQRHNGHIEVESEPGSGTLFRITLPIRRHQPELESVAP